MPQTSTSNPPSSSLDLEKRAVIFERVRSQGEAATAAQLGISRQTLARALAGLRLSSSVFYMLEHTIIADGAKGGAL